MSKKWVRKLREKTQQGMGKRRKWLNSRGRKKAKVTFGRNGSFMGFLWPICDFHCLYPAVASCFFFCFCFCFFFDSSSLNKSESKKKLWVRRLDTTLEIDSSFVILCTNMSKLVLCVANLFEMMCSKFQLSSSNRSKVMPNYVGKFITKKGDKFLLIFSSNWPQAKFSKSR